MSNRQLTDTEYLESLKYKDPYYLEQLCRTVWEYIKNTPVPVQTSIFRKDEDIIMKFSIGKNNSFYKIEDSISYFDFVYRFKKEAEKFFPKYVYEEEIEVELSEKEMLEKVDKEGISLNDVLFLTKKEIQKNVGSIIKVHFLKDEFLLEHNGTKQMRMSGTDINNVVPVKIFLSNIREMIKEEKSGRDIKEYIFNNSVLLEELPVIENEVQISYPKKQMKSFFKVHYDELKNLPLEKITSQVYKWGKFIITFEDDVIEKDCLSYYQKRRNQDGK